MDRAAAPPAGGAVTAVLGRGPAGAVPPGAPPPAARPGPRRRWRRTALVAAVLVLIAVIAVVALRARSGGGPAPLTRADVDAAVQQGVQRAQQQQRAAAPDAATAYRTILPSLVTVTSRPAAGGAVELGAGTVVNASGAVLTALHVVEPGGKPAAGVQVRFSDGTVATATVATRQPAGDIAVLAVDHLPDVVVPAVLGGGARVGDPVYPVGNPLGLQGTLSAGVVSALDRTVTTETGGTLAGLIQFDAAVNPGNSGGPLLDRDGQVVGVVTGLANPSGQRFFIGIGFAVPIATAGGAAGLPPR